MTPGSQNRFASMTNIEYPYPMIDRLTVIDASEKCKNQNRMIF